MMKKIFYSLLPWAVVILFSSQALAAKPVTSDLFIKFEIHQDHLADRLTGSFDSDFLGNPSKIAEEELKKLAVLNEDILNALHLIGRELKRISARKTIQSALKGRHRDFLSHYRKEYKKLVSYLETLKNMPESASPEEIDKAVSPLIVLIRKNQVSRRQPLDPGNLPVGIASFEDSYDMQLPVSGPEGEDSSYLSETSGVVFSEAVEKLAGKLNENPIRMAQWVKNNIEYIPLYGSMKGSAACLQDLSGNDYDQASLLISLLRSSDIQARYVYGEIQVNKDKDLAAWLSTKDVHTAWDVLRSHGVPVKDNFFEHVWVEAFLENPSRWGVDGSPRWITLDPSFKRYRLTESPQLDKENLLTKLLESLFDSSIDQESILGRERDCISTRSIIREPIDTVLPYHVKKRLWAGATLGDEFAFRVKIAVEEAEGKVLFSKEFTLDELANRSVSLVYLPAGFQDSAIMKSLLNLSENPDSAISSLPAYLIRVRPHLLVGGRIVSSGERGWLGEKQNLLVTLNAPRFKEKTYRHTVIAGSQSALWVTAGGISHLTGHIDSTYGFSFKEKLLYEPLKYLEEKLGTAFLNQIGMDYQRDNSKVRQLVADRKGIVANSFFSEGLVSRAVRTGYLLGRPVFFEFSGAQLDVQADLICAAGGDEDFGKNRLLAAVGSYGSMLEHYVLDKASNKPVTAVSAIRVISKAREMKIPVKRFQPGDEKNIAELALPQALKSDILGALNRQQEVQIPERPVKIDDWEGYGYILTDLATGSQGYMIDGLGAGTSTNIGATSNITMPKGTIARFLIVLMVLGSIIAVVVLLA